MLRRVKLRTLLKDRAPPSPGRGLVNKAGALEAATNASRCKRQHGNLHAEENEDVLSANSKIRKTTEHAGLCPSGRNDQGGSDIAMKLKLRIDGDANLTTRNHSRAEREFLKDTTGAAFASQDYQHSTAPRAFVQNVQMTTSSSPLIDIDFCLRRAERYIGGSSLLRTSRCYFHSGRDSTTYGVPFIPFTVRSSALTDSPSLAQDKSIKPGSLQELVAQGFPPSCPFPSDLCSASCFAPPFFLVDLAPPALLVLLSSLSSRLRAPAAHFLPGTQISGDHLKLEERLRYHQSTFYAPGLTGD
eukprot:368846-Hanusia_phi.AAC.3